MIQYQHGWFQIAFERDLKQPINAVHIGNHELIITCVDGHWRAFDAYCPHRGAHLAHGGRVEKNVVICPFHDYQVGLGQCSTHGFKVNEYPLLAIAGLVFVRLSDSHDFGFESALRQLVVEHVIVPGFELHIHAPSQLIIENGFDGRHFVAVHDVPGNPSFKTLRGEHQELITEGVFTFGVSEWRPGNGDTKTALASYRLRAFSPGVTLGKLDGQFPYTLITSATPTPDDDSVLRLSLAVPIAHFGPTPRPELCASLLRYAQAGLEQDQVVWEHMKRGYEQHLLPADQPVQDFQLFCAQFTY